MAWKASFFPVDLINLMTVTLDDDWLMTLVVVCLHKMDETIEPIGPPGLLSKRPSIPIRSYSTPGETVIFLPGMDFGSKSFLF